MITAATFLVLIGLFCILAVLLSVRRRAAVRVIPSTMPPPIPRTLGAEALEELRIGSPPPIPLNELASTSADEPWRLLVNDEPVVALDEDTGNTVTIKPTQDDPDSIEGLLVRFHYVDASRYKSERVVLCWRCWGPYEVIYVQGFCTTAKALRTFRVDRMSDLEVILRRAPPCVMRREGEDIGV